MVTMADAVDPANIPAGVAAVAGYVDGPRSAWQADAWSRFAGSPVLQVSVLADTAAPAYDVEPGNASPAAVAVAVARRMSSMLPSVCYCNGSGVNELSQALRMKGVPWLPPSAWPHPGAYLWAADPTGEPHTSVAWAPVPPVAVQDRWLGAYDLSSLAGGWLPPTLPGAPPAPMPAGVPGKEADMVIVRGPSGAAIVFIGGHRFGVDTEAALQALQAAGAALVEMPDAATFDGIATAPLS